MPPRPACSAAGAPRTCTRALASGRKGVRRGRRRLVAGSRGAGGTSALLLANMEGGSGLARDRRGPRRPPNCDGLTNESRDGMLLRQPRGRRLDANATPDGDPRDCHGNTDRFQSGWPQFLSDHGRGLMSAAERWRPQVVRTTGSVTEAIYGLVLATSVIAVSREYDSSNAGLIGVSVLVTGVVFWLAHVYARVLAGFDHPPRRAGRAWRRGCSWSQKRPDRPRVAGFRSGRRSARPAACLWRVARAAQWARLSPALASRRAMSPRPVVPRAAVEPIGDSSSRSAPEASARCPPRATRSSRAAVADRSGEPRADRAQRHPRLSRAGCSCCGGRRCRGRTWP